MKFLFSALLVFSFFFAKSQNSINTLTCLTDSVSYASLNEFFSEKEYSLISIESLFYTVLNTKNSRDKSCSVLLYAKIFDHLLEQGLDLNYSIAKNRPKLNSTDFPTDSEFVKNDDQDNLKFKLFYDFLELKKHYEKYLVPQYGKDNLQILEDDVMKIIRYVKYEHLNRKKMERELVKHLGY